MPTVQAGRTGQWLQPGAHQCISKPHTKNGQAGTTQHSEDVSRREIKESTGLCLRCTGPCTPNMHPCAVGREVLYRWGASRSPRVHSRGTWGKAGPRPTLLPSWLALQGAGLADPLPRCSFPQTRTERRQESPLKHPPTASPLWTQPQGF